MLTCDKCNYSLEDGASVYQLSERQVELIGGTIDPFWGTFIICEGCKEQYAEKLAEADNECECGGEFDEDDRCDSCSNGHDDCEAQECFACFERANDRAELWADMARDEEMGL